MGGEGNKASEELLGSLPLLTQENQPLESSVPFNQPKQRETQGQRPPVTNCGQQFQKFIPLRCPCWKRRGLQSLTQERKSKETFRKQFAATSAVPERNEREDSYIKLDNSGCNSQAFQASCSS